MFLNADTRIIIGPPGTGKTGRLIKLATEVIADGCDPQYVGYVSFTRAAVQEARDRIMAATGRPKDLFVGFRTLHAMVFWTLGLDKSKIITDEEAMNTDADSFVSREQARMYSYMYNYHRVTGLRLSEVWERLHTEYAGTEEDFLQWVSQYRRFKLATGRIDFTDMIEEFTPQNIRFPFRYLFVDEAQDFTPDQWSGVKLLASCAGKVIVAGDADQAIFEWAGAAGNLFNEVEGKREVLSQSHRVPELPYIIARRVLEDMGRDILYHPKPEPGTVRWIFPEELESLPLDNGETWYLLARNNIYCKRLQAMLYRRGIFYQTLGISSSAKERGEGRHLRRIRWYQEAVETGQMSAFRRKDLLKVVPDLDKAIENKVPWFLAFAAWPIDRINYYRATSADWDLPPKVHVGTFHSAKGAEADNVVLVGDCTRRVAEAHYRVEPSEMKVLYVAVTRTRNRLYLVQPSKRSGIPWHKYIRLSPDLISG